MSHRNSGNAYRFLKFSTQYGEKNTDQKGGYYLRDASAYGEMAEPEQ